MFIACDGETQELRYEFNVSLTGRHISHRIKGVSSFGGSMAINMQPLRGCFSRGYDRD